MYHVPLEGFKLGGGTKDVREGGRKWGGEREGMGERRRGEGMKGVR